MKQDLQDRTAKSNGMRNGSRLGARVTLHRFWDKTSSIVSVEADFHYFSTVYNNFLNFLLCQTIFHARRFGTAHRPPHLQQNLVFVGSSPHSSLLFTLAKYFIKLCSFNWTSQILLPAAHSLCHLLLHMWKNYQKKSGAVFSFLVLPQCRESNSCSEKGQAEKWQNVLLFLQRLPFFIPFPVSSNHRIDYQFSSKHF